MNNGLKDNNYFQLYLHGRSRYPAQNIKTIPKNPTHERVDSRNPLPTHVPAPPAAPTVSNKRPSFLTLKNIVMDMDSLTAEQKLELIDKISDLYA